MYHYTDRNGYNSIVSGRTWVFRTHAPLRPGNPSGAYFTTLPPDSNNLATRIGISKDKARYFFSFLDMGDLCPLNPKRPAKFQVKFYSPIDYEVAPERQRDSGENPTWI